MSARAHDDVFLHILVWLWHLGLDPNLTEILHVSLGLNFLCRTWPLACV